MNREYTLCQNKNEIMELVKDNSNFTLDVTENNSKNASIYLGHNEDRSLGFMIVFGPTNNDILFEFNINDYSYSYFPQREKFRMFEVSGTGYNGMVYSEAIPNHEFYRKLNHFKSLL